MGRRAFLSSAIMVASSISTAHAQAQESAENLPAESTFEARTYARLFQRAPLPGPNGSIVTTDTRLPIVQYVSFWADGLDTRLGADTASIEVTAWQSSDAILLPGADADLQTASLTLRTAGENPHAWTRIGRQTKAGGAARFSRFDGIQGGVALVPELTLKAYAGLKVLPRWDQQPGYHHLGATAESLQTEAALFERLDRGDYTVVGGELRLDAKRLHASFSVHDETEGGVIGRRNVGADFAGTPLDELDLGGAVVFDVDSLKAQNARLFADYLAREDLDLSLQYVRAEPALLLSRQSVLSVFSDASYQELGAGALWRLSSLVSLSGSAWGQQYEEAGLGGRVSGELRFASQGPGLRGTFVTGYTRVRTTEGGYHSIRGAFMRQLSTRITGTLQNFTYLYDEPIRSRRYSSMNALTVDYSFMQNWAILGGASLATSPYADLDASTQIRLTYAYQGRNGDFR